eukprot:8157178-Alexandrium_andersonii.AAC.1
MDRDTVVDIMQHSDMGLAYAMFDYDTEQTLCARRDRHDPGLVPSVERQRERARELIAWAKGAMANWPTG